MSLAAATNELLQVFVITRSAGLADGFANVAGAVFGLFIVFTLRRIAWRRRAA
jgi:VanZ family protein